MYFILFAVYVEVYQLVFSLRGSRINFYSILFRLINLIIYNIIIYVE